jgi:hypothetical protein
LVVGDLVVSLGAQSGLITWAVYRRYPMFGVILMLIGGVLGAIVMGAYGLLLGGGGGLVLGIILGLSMGKAKNMFPVEIEIWTAYSSGDFGTAGKYPGRVVTQSFAGETGDFIERRIVQYLDGTTLKVLSNYSLPLWFKDADTRKLKVMQTDSNTFLPITVSRGVLTAHNVPVYMQDGKGGVMRFKVTADGKTHEKDAEGNLIPDENGMPYVKGNVDQVIFDSNMMLEQERGIIQIPKGLAAKLDNERVNYTQAYRIASEFNKSGGWWARNGQLVLALVSIVLTFTIVLFGYIKYTEVSGIVGDKINSAVIIASENNMEAAKLNAQIAAAYLKVGYNYSAVFYIRNETIANSPAATPLRVPFLG